MRVVNWRLISFLFALNHCHEIYDLTTSLCHIMKVKVVVCSLIQLPSYFCLWTSPLHITVFIFYLFFFYYCYCIDWQWNCFLKVHKAFHHSLFMVTFSALRLCWCFTSWGYCFVKEIAKTVFFFFSPQQLHLSCLQQHLIRKNKRQYEIAGSHSWWLWNN